MANGLVEELKDSDGIAALRAALASERGTATSAPADTVARSAVAVTADSLRGALHDLESENKALTTERDRLRNDAESRDEGLTIRKIFGSISDVLGFGIGWTALYFTVFTLHMRGQTPGKKLLGIRVIRLDGQPITGWIAFERFGGYAASAATGLLGFAQILWDRNRQGIHDKVTETVVIREKRGMPVRPVTP